MISIPGRFGDRTLLTHLSRVDALLYTGIMTDNLAMLCFKNVKTASLLQFIYNFVHVLPLIIRGKEKNGKGPRGFRTVGRI